MNEKDLEISLNIGFELKQGSFSIQKVFEHENNPQDPFLKIEIFNVFVPGNPNEFLFSVIIKREPVGTYLSIKNKNAEIHNEWVPFTVHNNMEVYLVDVFRKLNRKFSKK